MLPSQLAEIFTSFTLSSHLLAALLFIVAFSILFNQDARRQVNKPFVGLLLGLFILQLSALGLATGLILQKWLAVFYIVSYGLWQRSLIQSLEFATTRSAPKVISYSVLCLWLSSIATLVIISSDLFSAAFEQLSSDSKNLRFFILLANALAVLLLGEQTLRNAARPYRIHVRYMFIGIGVIVLTHIYQLGYFYLFNTWETFIPLIDGYISTAVGLLFIMSALRNQPNQPLSVSRSIAFYTTSITLIGLFLLSMAAAGYLADLNAENWTSGIQIVIFITTFIGVCVATFSSSLRRSIKVFVNKHFFRHKYDYRSVWLELIHTFSDISEKENFHSLGLQALAKIFDANGGAMWLKAESGFQLKTSWNITGGECLELYVDDNADFLSAFDGDEWIYAFNSNENHRELFHPIDPPKWIETITDAWILAPLKIGSNLAGFILLTRTEQGEALIWEDIDVIKSASRQLASYIVRQRSAEQLAEAKQFDTYNKLTAFIMHDLKNLIAQQALVVKNANKHKDNPAFVEDAIRTIDNSVQRMSHLLSRLQRNPQHATNKVVSLKRVALEAIRKSTDRQPIPTLRTQTDGSVFGDPDQLTMILVHLIRNAQDATANDGFIDIEISTDERRVSIEIEDNGHGMDEDFIKNRLFKPFESTKSSQGMGIGAYQVREFIHAMNGSIRVSSELEVGTTVCIELPVIREKTTSIKDAHSSPSSDSARQS